MDYKEIGEAREHEVVRHNDMIQKSRHQLTLQEQKIMQYVISLIKPADKAMLTYVFNISDFCQICGIDYDNGKNYKNIKDSLRSLLAAFWVKIDKNTETTMRWIDRVTIHKYSGLLEIKLDDMLMPYLLHLKNNYTQYHLKYVLAMRSKYSIRLYEILRSYLYRGEPVKIDLAELKSLVDAENHKLYANFQNRVLEPAKAEINALTDIKFEYEPIKTGRKVTAIIFHITQKTDMGERLDAWAKIEKKLEAKKTRGKKS